MAQICCSQNAPNNAKLKKVTSKNCSKMGQSQNSFKKLTTTTTDEISRYRGHVQFHHKFEQVKKLTDKGQMSLSPIFYIRNIPFKLRLRSVVRYDNAESGAEGGAGDGKIELELRCALVCQEGKSGFSCKISHKFSLIRPNGLPPLSQDDVEEYTYQNPGHMSCHSPQFTRLLNDEDVLVDDAVTIGVSLWADEPQQGNELGFGSPKNKLISRLQSEENAKLGAGFGCLLDSGEFADLTLLVKEADGSKVSFKVHKVVLAARSPVFAEILSKSEGPRPGQLAIVEMGGKSLKIFLRHLYTGELVFPKDVTLGMTICKELVIAGNKYKLLALKEVAGMALSEFVSPENAEELLKFVKSQGAEAGTKALSSYYAENVFEIMKTF